MDNFCKLGNATFCCLYYFMLITEAYAVGSIGCHLHFWLSNTDDPWHPWLITSEKWIQWSLIKLKSDGRQSYQPEQYRFSSIFQSTQWKENTMRYCNPNPDHGMWQAHRYGWVKPYCQMDPNMLWLMTIILYVKQIHSNMLRYEECCLGSSVMLDGFLKNKY